MDKNSTEEYRNNITLHLTKMCSDIGHIKEKVNENNKHLIRLNGRVRENEKQISCQVHTNASLRTPDYWKEIAYLTKKNPHSMVKFSIDGLHDTNHLYRRGSNWEKIMENAQAFIDAGGRAWWQYIVFDWNKHQVALARKLARKMGFDAFKYRHDRSWSPSSEEAKKYLKQRLPKSILN